ncbi:MAG: transcriptional regulator [Bacteroidetes bacterium GWA2_31_9]|nr:MAG: transcriptional regulator [Bacteroidetes bacterium GWA2_31_9]
MPEISRFYGIIIKMFYKEHNPPHFHIEYQDYKAIITIKEGIVEGQMPKTALKLVFEWLELHKNELMQNWKSMEEKKPLNKVEPLN